MMGVEKADPAGTRKRHSGAGSGQEGCDSIQEIMECFCQVSPSLCLPLSFALTRMNTAPVVASSLLIDLANNLNSEMANCLEYVMVGTKGVPVSGMFLMFWGVWVYGV